MTALGRLLSGTARSIPTGTPGLDCEVSERDEMRGDLDRVSHGIGRSASRPRELIAAVLQAFDLRTDSIVWERATAAKALSVLDEPNPKPRHRGRQGTGRRRATRASHAAAGAVTIAEPGQGLAIALKLAQSRKRLERNQWIVTIVGTQSLLAGLTQSAIEHLQEVDSRFLLIVCGEMPRVRPRIGPTLRAGGDGQYESLDSTWLRELGISYTELAVDQNSHGLAGDLQRLKRSGQAELLHLKPRPSVVVPSAPDESPLGERGRIGAIPLTPVVRQWTDAYALVGNRSTYLWQWCQRGVELTTLPCVAPELKTHVCDTKVLSIMVNVLLDDVADCQGGEKLLSQLFLITRNHGFSGAALSAADRRYAEFTRDVWREYWNRARGYPLYELYGELLSYDLSQLFNTIRYSSLVNRNPCLLNMAEHNLYSPHSMMQMSFATLDLMCTESFPLDELGKLREAVWHAQCMGRIGNLVTTWQREIGDRDFTSGVFAHAVAAGELSVNDLLFGEPVQIETAIRRGGHEDHFLREWEYHLACLTALQRRFGAFDLGEVIQGLKQLLETELDSRGLK